jgi:hypothetical protein
MSDVDIVCLGLLTGLLLVVAWMVMGTYLL